MQKPAITQVEIQTTIANRWSPRAYNASKPVTREQITAMLEAARWAPSSFGDQPWRIVVCDKTTHPQAWQHAFDCLVPANQTWATRAPVLMLACANTLFDHNSSPNRFAQYDTGAAVANLCLQATDLGLATHQMGGFDAEKARTAFNIPAQFTLMAMITVGYEGDIDQLPEELKTRETAPRKRKPLSETFYEGAWNTPVKT